MILFYKLYEMETSILSSQMSSVILLHVRHNYTFCVCKEFAMNLIHFCGCRKCNYVQY